MRTHAAALVVLAALGAACGQSSSGADPKWAEHMGDIPFVVGQAKGASQVTATGRPPMYFFTATW